VGKLGCRHHLSGYTMGRNDLIAEGMGLFLFGLCVRFSCASQSPLCYDLHPSMYNSPRCYGEVHLECYVPRG
jgi:hypothetical protein